MSGGIRWGAVFEGVEEETELGLCFFRGESEEPEHVALQFAVMNQDTLVNLQEVVAEVTAHRASLVASGIAA